MGYCPQESLQQSCRTLQVEKRPRLHDNLQGLQETVPTAKCFLIITFFEETLH